MKWNEFYKKHKFRNPSSFARFVSDCLYGKVIDLGCGEGRDVRYFKKNNIDVIGIDSAFGVKIEDYIKNNKSPDCVYTRFLWHSINRKLQLRILKWTKDLIFIESRTTQDKPKNVFGKHKRNLVDVPQLVKDLKNNNFEILYLSEGMGESVFNGEDPHLVRVLAQKR